MKSLVTFAICSIVLMSVVSAQEGGRQIRLDANTCKNISPEYLQKRNNPLYAKAIVAKNAGHANEMQGKRIREVDFLYYTLKAAKCKVSK